MLFISLCNPIVIISLDYPSMCVAQKVPIRTLASGLFESAVIPFRFRLSVYCLSVLLFISLWQFEKPFVWPFVWKGLTTPSVVFLAS